MEVILKSDVKNLGYKDELVSVKPGYGRNFLIPKGFAIIANETNKKVLAETQKQRAHKESKLKAAAEDIAAKLNKMVVKVGAKVGESEKIFGSVTSVQLAEAIRKEGFEVDRKNIKMSEESIKTTGAYTADVRLHKDVNIKLNFEVVAE